MRPFRKCGSFVVRFPDGRPSKYFYWDDLPSRRLRPDLVTSEVLGAGQKRLLELSASGWDDDNSASPCHPAEFDAGRMFKRPQLTDDACVCAAVSANRTRNCRDRSRSRRRNKANRPPANFCRPTDHGPGQYFICLREANPPPDKRHRYYSVFFDNDTYKGSRLSVIMDECETQAFSPLPTAAPTTPAPNAKSTGHKAARGPTQ